jgi:signal transduction histidine kinase
VIEIIETISLVIENKYKGSHRIELSYPPDVKPVWVDQDRLEQILTNLLDNAVKYSPQSDKVEAKIANVIYENRDMVEIAIKDYGIGISDDHTNSIFDKFSRLDNPLSRQTEGTGLGLFISLSLAKLMQGDLKVDSSKDEGSTFTLYLPAKSTNHDEDQTWD